MKILDATWHPEINVLTIECDCGTINYHRADRWRVVCKGCKAKQHLGAIRDAYRKRKAGLD